MKYRKLKTVILSIFVMFGTLFGATEIHAKEEVNSENFKFEIHDHYSENSKGRYEEGVVYYQQNTGVNTLRCTSVEVRDYSDTLLRSYTLDYSEDDFASFKILNNPAENPDFIKTPQKFEITAELTIKQTNETIEIKIPAEVVEVQGTIMREVKEIYKETFSYPFKKTQGFKNDPIEYEVRLKDGSYITEETWSPTNYGGSGGYSYDSLGYFLYFIDGAFQQYDLKYVGMVKDGGQIPSDRDIFLQKIYYARLVDENNNIVDIDKNILIPAAERENIEISSHQGEVSIFMKEGNFPDNSRLEIKKRVDLNLHQEYLAYDISMHHINEKVQPVAPVEVSVKLPSKFVGKNISVYYISDDGSMEKVKNIVSNDAVTFETSRFSTYAIVLNSNDGNDPIKPIEPNEDVQKPTDFDKGNQELVEKTPETSDYTMIFMNLLLMGASILLIIIIGFKKKIEA